MRDRKILLLLGMAVLISLCSTGCIKNEKKEKEAELQDIKKKVSVEEKQENVSKLSWAEQKMEEMTLEEKVSQLFLITPEALTGVGQAVAAGEKTRECIDAYPVGGVIYFSGNIESKKQFCEMIENSKRYAMERNGIPLFVSVDEEGGTVARVADSSIPDIPQIEDMVQIGANKDLNRAYEVGKTIGGYLRDLGFNMDFAPVADVLTNEDNTVVKYRAFGSDASLVSEMILKEMEGFEDSGILPVVKHFPGHGNTSGDTHEGYSYTERSLDEMMACDLVPFQEAIQAGIPFVMVGHISTPNITRDKEPASVSHMMVTEILREKLGFQGIVITDSLSMGAIIERYSAEEIGVKVIEAGGDMILMPQDFRKAYEGVLNAVKSGKISEERIEESVMRILTVKETLLER